MNDYKDVFKRKTIIKWKLTQRDTKDFSKQSGVSTSSLYCWAKSQINSAKRLNLPFELNTMQEKAMLKQGENIIINAPTGSVKTESILLNCLPGQQYYYFLPTVTSCVFMFFRLMA